MSIVKRVNLGYSATLPCFSWTVKLSTNCSCVPNKVGGYRLPVSKPECKVNVITFKQVVLEGGNFVLVLKARLAFDVNLFSACQWP